MQFDFQSLEPMVRYELLLGTVVPRPVTIITTRSSNGVVNAAPYSLFNVVSHDPPVIMIAALPRADGRQKDTTANVFATREFAANLVPRSMADAMNITNVDAPSDISELTLAGLDVAPSCIIQPPRIAASPVTFECRFLTALSFASNQAVIFGQVLTAFVADEFVIDGPRGVVDTPKLDLFGAMHGARWYCSTNERFEMVRQNWEQWIAGPKP